jgi:formate dehydrogenase subunit delta
VGAHTIDKLVIQANQIAAFFAAQGEERAVPQIADHVKKFWDPRMRKTMAAHLDAGGAGLHALALSALARTLKA